MADDELKRLLEEMRRESRERFDSLETGLRKEIATSAVGLRGEIASSASPSPKPKP